MAILKKNRAQIIFLCFLCPLFFLGQTKEDLKKEKQLLEEEISYTNKLLKKSKQEKHKTLNYLKVLNKNVNTHKKLIKTFSTEISLLAKQIKRTQDAILNTESTINTQTKNLQLLKDEYAKIIYSTFVKKGNQNNLMFIISAEDFNQSYKRIIYLKQYSFFRKNQSKKIKETQNLLKIEREELIKKKDKLFKEKAEKKDLILIKNKKVSNLLEVKEEHAETVKSLIKSEKLFKTIIQDKEKRQKKLDQKIRKIIEEEIKKARKKYQKKNVKNKYLLTPEAIAISSEFELNKGKLPWPLSKGAIVQSYGKQKHDVFTGIETFNNGIDIATEENTIVRSVFDGTISRIFFIKGDGKAILINHGEYFTVYSGLREVFVKAEEKVLAKEKIGIIITQELERKTELHFEIWKGYEKQDPSKWLFNAY